MKFGNSTDFSLDGRYKGAEGLHIKIMHTDYTIVDALLYDKSSSGDGSNLRYVNADETGNEFTFYDQLSWQETYGTTPPLPPLPFNQ